MATQQKKSGDSRSKRGAPRTGMVRPGIFQVGDEAHACVLQNISTTGAKVRLVEPMDEEITSGTLKLADFGEFEAEVAWRHGTEMGLKFDHEISFEITTDNLAPSVNDILGALAGRRAAVSD